MSDNRERDISRLLLPGWTENFTRYLAELAPVGPATARKYRAVVKALMGKPSTMSGGERWTFSLDEATRTIKRKNRVYIRAAIIKFMEFLEHVGIIEGTDNRTSREVMAGMVALLPKVYEPPPKPREIPAIPEIIGVMEKLEKEDRMIARFMLFTGCRIHEALGIRLRDINFKNGTITIYGKGRLQKKSRAGKVPMDFALEIEKYTASLGILGGETIFWANSKASIESKVDMFNRKLKVAFEEVLGKSTGSHDFRRIVATKLYKETRDIQLVQKTLGHAKIETTQKYTQYIDRESDMIKARDIMGNIEGLKGSPPVKSRGKG